jgi:hypothetical protein
MSKSSDPKAPMYYVACHNPRGIFGREFTYYGPYSRLSTAKAQLGRIRQDWFHRNKKITIEKHVSTCVAVIDSDRPPLQGKSQVDDQPTSD